MFSRMVRLMVDAHSGQVDKAGKPYFHHPLRVMKYLRSDDLELQLIALGHDLFEDTSVSPQILAELGFSERVIAGITALTKQRGQSYVEYQLAILASYDAMRVKLADLEDNMDLTRLPFIQDSDLRRYGRYAQFKQIITEALVEYDDEYYLQQPLEVLDF